MKTKFGSIIVAGSGKIGGHVASKNSSGTYLRTKSTPVNPQTAAQADVRAAQAANSQGWAGLTPDEQAAWNSDNAFRSNSNVFGDATKISGFNAFVRQNNNLMKIGESAITTMPAPVAVPSVSGLSAAADASAHTLILTFAPTPVPAGFAMLVEASPMVAAGISYVKNKMRVIKTVAAGVATGVDVSAEYIAKFGNIETVGLKIIVRARLVSTATGQESVPVQAATLIVS